MKIGKQIFKETTGNIETIKTEIAEISKEEEVIIREFLDDLNDNVDDFEEYLSMGFQYDYWSELFSIDFSSLYNFIDDRMSDLEEQEEQEETEYEILKKIKPIIQKYRGWNY
jgi:hypothetical protein